MIPQNSVMTGTVFAKWQLLLWLLLLLLPRLLLVLLVVVVVIIITIISIYYPARHPACNPSLSLMTGTDPVWGESDAYTISEEFFKRKKKWNWKLKTRSRALGQGDVCMSSQKFKLHYLQSKPTCLDLVLIHKLSPWSSISFLIS